MLDGESEEKKAREREEEEEKEKEKEREEAERPKTTEELWGSTETDWVPFVAQQRKKKERKKTQGEHSEREVFVAAVEMLEEILQEFLSSYVAVEVSLVKESSIHALVLKLQARFRGRRWRTVNFMTVNRLDMRAGSRRKKKRNEAGRGGRR